MNNTPVIDLSLRAPQQIISDQGIARGVLLVLWFRLLRPACVGSMWAGITIYAYRYLLPFEQGDLSWPELVSYFAAIGAIASVLTMWMILARVAHPFASKSRTQRLLRRKAGLTVEPGPFTGATSRDLNAVARVFVASHDANGLIAALRVLSVTGPDTNGAGERQPASGGAYGNAKQPEYSPPVDSSRRPPRH
ncbi:Biofilm PGA synthesis auxiliary protein PgaD [Paraburkholderia tagetis]|uniref:Biofilm PGA synthesis auxiliary protein PgaD n=1 Tax=Paraburkholderia tagetis TaxID=2913261 RepID=A0A9X1RU51_9BURK|nr:Biofilm PGA synthesis auxiliary protein PgaD [Paraburkholderia tagetis]MCG5076161.1 Biofilm PGA synthesis auxiliary protein PgaD [Paraburkholderia tagetis]